MSLNACATFMGQEPGVTNHSEHRCWHLHSVCSLSAVFSWTSLRQISFWHRHVQSLCCLLLVSLTLSASWQRTSGRQALGLGLGELVVDRLVEAVADVHRALRPKLPYNQRLPCHTTLAWSQNLVKTHRPTQLWWVHAFAGFSSKNRSAAPEYTAPHATSMLSAGSIPRSEPSVGATSSSAFRVSAQPLQASR